MSEVSYRLAVPDDAAALAALRIRTFTETFGHLYRPEDLADFLGKDTEANWRSELGSADYVVRLAVADGEVVGFVKLGPPTLPVDPDRVPIELRQFYLRAPWHGTGVADAMMRWALAEARGRGAKAIYLSVYSENHRARRFYERHGFELVGKHPFRIGAHWDDDDVMRALLDEVAS